MQSTKYQTQGNNNTIVAICAQNFRNCIVLLHYWNYTFIQQTFITTNCYGLPKQFSYTELIHKETGLKKVQKKHISHIWKYGVIKEKVLAKLSPLISNWKDGSFTSSCLFHEENRTAFSFSNQKSLTVNVEVPFKLTRKSTHKWYIQAGAL
jgi:hypothetical protein